MTETTSHYFIENPDLPTRERELSLEIFGQNLKFITNSGLFSCDKIDEASLALIQNIPQPLSSGDFLDLGCGYGVIGIALAKSESIRDKSNSITLTQSDINRAALVYAEKNAKLNGVASNFIHSDGFENIPQKFDTITLNPPIHAGKEVMYRLYEEAAAHLKPNGAFYIVIQKKHGAESSVNFLKKIFLYHEILFKKKGCFVVKFANIQKVED